MNSSLIFLAAYWILIPVFAWLDKKLIYKKGILTEIETRGSVFGYYFTRCLFEAAMLTAGFIGGMMIHG